MSHIELTTSGGEDTVEARDLLASDEYTDAFTRYLKYGYGEMSNGEQSMLRQGGPENRALGTVVGAEGGYLVPEGFVNSIREALLGFGGLRSAPVGHIVTDSGNDLPWPNADDSGNSGELVSENAAVSEQDLAFGQTVLNAWLWSSKLVRVPFALMEDSNFDLASFLGSALGNRIGRAQAPFLISGTGASQPEGIITGTLVGKTAASQTVFTYGELVDLEDSIDPAYQDQGSYVVSRGALKVLRQLEDANNLPLWSPGIAVGDVAPTINGFPYVVDLQMDAMGASNKPVLFGDLSGYVIRDVGSVRVQRLDERYAEFGQVAFLAWARMDSRSIAPDDAYAVLQMAA